MKIKPFTAGITTEHLQLHPKLTCINHLQPEAEDFLCIMLSFDPRHGRKTTQKLLTDKTRKNRMPPFF